MKTQRAPFASFSKTGGFGVKLAKIVDEHRRLESGAERLRPKKINRRPSPMPAAHMDRQECSGQMGDHALPVPAGAIANGGPRAAVRSPPHGRGGSRPRGVASGKGRVVADDHWQQIRRPGLFPDGAHDPAEPRLHGREGALDVVSEARYPAEDPPGAPRRTQASPPRR